MQGTTDRRGTIGACKSLKGTVVGGKVVLNDGSLPEGAEVAVFVLRQEGVARLPLHLQRELDAALDEADREAGISAEELFAELRRYGSSCPSRY